jgi:hypothetical protein
LRCKARDAPYFSRITVAFSRHERTGHYRPKMFLSARLQRVVLAVLVRVLTRRSDQAHAQIIPDVNRQRNICPRTFEHGLVDARRNELTGGNGENRGELTSVSVYSAPSVFNPTGHDYEKKVGPQIDADGHRFPVSINHICVNLCHLWAIPAAHHRARSSSSQQLRHFDDSEANHWIDHTMLRRRYRARTSREPLRPRNFFNARTLPITRSPRTIFHLRTRRRRLGVHRIVIGRT